jgi:hypothetical protein
MAGLRSAQSNECTSAFHRIAAMAEIRIAQRLTASPPELQWTRWRLPGVLEAGLAAGGIALAAMSAVSVTAYDESPWKLPRMMAAIVAGPGVLEPADEFDAAIVALGLALHFALAVLYTTALASVLRDVRREAAPLAGMAFGMLLYVANLHGFTALFGWFEEMRTADTFVAHVLFGLLAASLCPERARN